jgi:hypothetical protein
VIEKSRRAPVGFAVLGGLVALLGVFVVAHLHAFERCVDRPRYSNSIFGGGPSHLGECARYELDFWRVFAVVVLIAVVATAIIVAKIMTASRVTQPPPSETSRSSS